MRRQITLTLVLLCLAGACARRINQVPAAAPQLAPDSSFTDLTHGGRLRVLVPLLKSGEYRVATNAKAESGNTIVLSAENLIGYQVSYYDIEARRHGKVRLSFSSAQMTKDGRTTQELSRPKLPFALPGKAEHIRLIYYIRNSNADHNMAIAASKDMDVLNAFTERLKLDPIVCKSDSDVFCSWVPSGIAVRVE